MSTKELSSLTLQQLIDLNHEVVALIKARQQAAAYTKRAQLSRGMRVFFKDGMGQTIYGSIEKVMRTRANVRTEDGRMWKCHLNLLTRC